MNMGMVRGNGCVDMVVLFEKREVVGMGRMTV